MNSFYDRYGNVHTEEISKLSIQPIHSKDLMGKAFAANKILNLYFQQVNKELKLLPENNLDPEIKKMPRIGYFYYINELIYQNSKSLGFNYPLYEKHLSFAVNTKEKVYSPIMKHINKLIDK